MTTVPQYTSKMLDDHHAIVVNVAAVTRPAVDAAALDHLAFCLVLSLRLHHILYFLVVFSA